MMSWYDWLVAVALVGGTATALVCLPALTVLSFLVNRKLAALMGGKASGAAILTVSRTQAGIPVVRLAGETTEADDVLRADRARRAREAAGAGARTGPAPDEVPVGHEHLDDEPEAQPTVNLQPEPYPSPESWSRMAEALADPAKTKDDRRAAAASLVGEAAAEAFARGFNADPDGDGRLGTIESVAAGTVGYVHPVHFRPVDGTTSVAVNREAGVYPADVLEPGEQETHVTVEKVTTHQGVGLKVWNWPADARPGGVVTAGRSGDYGWVVNPAACILGAAAPEPPKTTPVKPYKSPLTTPVGGTVTVPARAVFRVRAGVWVDGGVFFPEADDVTVDVRKTGARQVEVVRAPNGWTPEVREALPATTVFAVKADPQIPATTAPAAAPPAFLAVGDMGAEEVGYVHCTKFVKLGDRVLVRRGGQVHQRDIGNCVHLIRTHTGVQVLAWPAGVALSTILFREPPTAEGFTPPEHLLVDNPRACGLHTPVTPNPA